MDKCIIDYYKLISQLSSIADIERTKCLLNYEKVIPFDDLQRRKQNYADKYIVSSRVINNEDADNMR